MELNFEYDNKSQRTVLTRRATIFYVSTGKPGRKLSVINKVALLPMRERACLSAERICIVHLGQQCATVVGGIYSVSLCACRSHLERLLFLCSMFSGVNQPKYERNPNMSSNAEKSNASQCPPCMNCLSGAAHMSLSVDIHDVTYCALRNIRGMAYKVPVDHLRWFIQDQKKQRENKEVLWEYCIDKSCNYVLFGEDGKGDMVVYIGETDSIEKRIPTHDVLRDNEYTWDHIVIFCRTDYDFNKGHIEHIERKLRGCP